MSDSRIVPPLLVKDSSWQQWNEVMRLNAKGFIRKYTPYYKEKGEDVPVVPAGYVIILHQGISSDEAAIISQEVFQAYFKPGGNLYVRKGP
jgi:hypothetical protein